MARVETQEVFGTLYSVPVIAKARRLVEKVNQTAHDMWEVEGDHGTYRVHVNPAYAEKGITRMWCNCRLREHRENLITVCSHGLAVRMVVEQTRRSAA